MRESRIRRDAYQRRQLTLPKPHCPALMPQRLFSPEKHLQERFGSATWIFRHGRKPSFLDATPLQHVSSVQGVRDRHLVIQKPVKPWETEVLDTASNVAAVHYRLWASLTHFHNSPREAALPQPKEVSNRPRRTIFNKISRNTIFSAKHLALPQKYNSRRALMP